MCSTPVVQAPLARSPVPPHRDPRPSIVSPPAPPLPPTSPVPAARHPALMENQDAPNSPAMPMMAAPPAARGPSWTATLRDCRARDRWATLPTHVAFFAWSLFTSLFPLAAPVPSNGVATDGLFLHTPSERVELMVMQHVCDKADLPVGSLPSFDPDNYPGDIPTAVREALEYKESAAHLERFFRRKHRVLVCASQVECVSMSHDNLTDLCPALPLWWYQVEVPYGMPVALHNVVSLRGSLLQSDRPENGAAAALSSSWLLSVAVVLAGSVVSKKILWLIPQALVDILADADYAALCNGDDTLRHVLGAALELLRVLWIDQYAVEAFLGETLDERRALRCEYRPEGGAGRVYLRESVDLPGLPCTSDVLADVVMPSVAPVPIIPPPPHELW